MEKGAEGSRRDFLKKGAGTVTGLLAPPMIVSASALGRGATPPSDRVTVGIIGSGQRAVFETLQYPCFDNAVIVAVSDAVRNHAQSAKDALANNAGGSATPVLPVPDGFNYDAWLGPAPAKPFCYDRCLRPDRAGIFNISDYTLGLINNWAAHPLDQMQRWADASGRKDPPVHYQGSGTFPKEGLFDCATQWRVQCTWADGLVLDFMDNRTYLDLPDVPHPVINPPDVTVPNGVVFMGTEGWVLVSYGNDGKVVTQPASLMESVIGSNEIHIPDSALETIPDSLPKGFQQTLTAGHHQNWIRAIRTGSSVVDPIESAFRSDMISQLSQICIRTGQPVQWDPKKETIMGNDEATKMMKRPMRAPWGV